MDVDRASLRSINVGHLAHQVLAEREIFREGVGERQEEVLHPLHPSFELPVVGVHRNGGPARGEADLRGRSAADFERIAGGVTDERHINVGLVARGYRVEILRLKQQIGLVRNPPVDRGVYGEFVQSILEVPPAAAGLISRHQTVGELLAIGRDRPAHVQLAPEQAVAADGRPDGSHFLFQRLFRDTIYQSARLGRTGDRGGRALDDLDPIQGEIVRNVSAHSESVAVGVKGRKSPDHRAIVYILAIADVGNVGDRLRVIIGADVPHQGRGDHTDRLRDVHDRRLEAGGGGERRDAVAGQFGRIGDLERFKFDGLLSFFGVLGPGGLG